MVAAVVFPLFFTVNPSLAGQQPAQPAAPTLLQDAGTDNDDNAALLLSLYVQELEGSQNPIVRAR